MHLYEERSITNAKEEFVESQRLTGFWSLGEIQWNEGINDDSEQEVFSYENVLIYK